MVTEEILEHFHQILFIKANTRFWSHLAEFLEIFQTKVVGNIISKHTVCVTFFFFIFFLLETSAICEIIYENVVELDRPQMTIWRIRIACWTPKATDTLLEYSILTAFPLLQWLYERASMLRYTCIACLVYSWLDRPGGPRPPPWGSSITLI